MNRHRLAISKIPTKLLSDPTIPKPVSVKSNAPIVVVIKDNRSPTNASSKSAKRMSRKFTALINTNKNNGSILNVNYGFT